MYVMTAFLIWSLEGGKLGPYKNTKWRHSFVYSLEELVRLTNICRTFEGALLPKSSESTRRHIPEE
jgi:hypothetical protein